MARQPTPQATIDYINGELRSRYGDTITRKQFLEYSTEFNVWPGWIRSDKSLRRGRGLYAVPSPGYVVPRQPTPPRAQKRRDLTPAVMARLQGIPLAEPPARTTTARVSEPDTMAMATEAELSRMTAAEKLEALRTRASLLSKVPEVDPAFVPFGDYDTIKDIIETGEFFPVFITGMSGNGKSCQVEQACAETGREFIRLQITDETDEDDLLGGMRLVNGTTVFVPGPVIVGMVRGAVVLHDEIDYASPKITCLQSVLEGKPVVLKKLGITVAPAPGFLPIATANTKGRGSEDGRYVGTNLLNDAFLERFAVTIEQAYPPPDVEQEILRRYYVKLGRTVTPQVDAEFAILVRWADTIRETFVEGGVDDMITTRRLTHIVRGYSMFGDLRYAVRLCTNRFDVATRTAFLSIFDRCLPYSN